MNEITFEPVPEEAGLTTTIYDSNVISSFGTGSFKTSNSGFSGDSYYDFAGTGDYVEWSVNSDVDTTTPISFRYAMSSSSYSFNRPCQLWVNNVMVEAVYDFKYTDGSSKWMYSKLVDINLNAGSNSIKLLVADQNGGPNIDHLLLGKRQA